MGQVGKIAGLAMRPAKRAPMCELVTAHVARATGVANDFRGRPGKRQVTILCRAAWTDACAEIGKQLPWTTRRANLLIEGLDLRNTTGWDLRIGSVLLTITGETTPCSRMDEACPGLKDALVSSWRGGVTAFVARAGQISLADEVTLERSLARQLAVISYLFARQVARRLGAALRAVGHRVGLRSVA
jgi:MOSC domain-containing protein YiiM